MRKNAVVVAAILLTLFCFGTAAYAVDLKSVEEKWTKSKKFLDEHGEGNNVTFSVTWFADEYIQATMQREAEKNMWTQDELDRYSYEYIKGLRLDEFTPVLVKIENDGPAMHMAPFDRQIVLWIGEKKYEPVEYEKRFNFPLIGAIEGLVFFPRFDEKSGKPLLDGVSNVKVGIKGSVTELYPGAGYIDFQFSPSKDSAGTLFSAATLRRLEMDRLLKRQEKLGAEKTELETKLKALYDELDAVRKRMDELQKQ